jgi:hypothetical protein
MKLVDYYNAKRSRTQQSHSILFTEKENKWNETLYTIECQIANRILKKKKKLSEWQTHFASDE